MYSQLCNIVIHGLIVNAIYNSFGLKSRPAQAQGAAASDHKNTRESTSCCAAAASGCNAGVRRHIASANFGCICSAGCKRCSTIHCESHFSNEKEFNEHISESHRSDYLHARVQRIVPKQITAYTSAGIDRILSCCALCGVVFLSRMSRWLLGVLLSAVGTESLHPVAPQTLGTWLPNYGDNLTNLIATPAVAAQTFAAFKALGGNTVYIDVYHAGATAYPSQAWENATGLQWNASGTAVDYLSFTVPLAKASGLQVVLWYEWGTMLGPELISAHPDWVIGQDPTFSYANASNSEYQQYLIGIVQDALQHPVAAQIDGIQFDDHFCWPASMPATGGPSQAQKQAALTTLIGRLQGAVKGRAPRMLFSLAPNPAAYSLDSFNVPWPAWLAAGTVDEAVIQLYTWSYEGFLSSFLAQQAAVNNDPALIAKLKAGILLNNGATVNANGTAMMIAEISAAGSPSTPWAGQVLWYARGVLLYSAANVSSVWATA